MLVVILSVELRAFLLAPLRRVEEPIFRRAPVVLIAQSCVAAEIIGDIVQRSPPYLAAVHARERASVVQEIERRA